MLAIGTLSEAVSASLGSLSDVDTTGATAGNVLTFDGTQWEPGSGPTTVMRAQAGQASFQLYTTGGKTVTFPTAFAAAPRVLLTLANTPASTADVISLNVDDVTATSFYIYANCPNNFAGATAYVNWLAIPNGALTL